MRAMRFANAGWVAVLAAGVMAAPVFAQSAAPKVSGVVKATTATGMTVTSAAGQDVSVTVPATAKLMLVDPKTMDVKSATAGTLADVAVGDKAIVTGTAGDEATALNATRVYLLKAAAIAQTHAATDAAWAQGLGQVRRQSADPMERLYSRYNATERRALRALAVSGSLFGTEAELLDLPKSSAQNARRVLLDSGVRTGADVFKALALGAEAVLIGRPYLYGLALAGEAGARDVVRNIIAEFDLTLGLSGLTSLAELGPEALRRI